MPLSMRFVIFLFGLLIHNFLLAQKSAPSDDKVIYGASGSFSHYTEIGALAATKNRPDNVTTAAFTFQTVNGYKFNQYLFTGIGVAADLYAKQTIVPVFASVRGDFIHTGIFIPFYFVDGGYGFDIT